MIPSCVCLTCVCLYRVVCSWCVVVDTHTLSPTKNREKIAFPLNGTHAYTCIMRTHVRTRTYTGTLVCIIAPTHARTGAWVSEMRTFRKLKNCGNCSILTPTPTYNMASTPPTTSPIHLSHPHPNPLKPLILPHSHYILTTPYLPMHTLLHTRI